MRSRRVITRVSIVETERPFVGLAGAKPVVTGFALIVGFAGASPVIGGSAVMEAGRAPVIEGIPVIPGIVDEGSAEGARSEAGVSDERGVAMMLAVSYGL